MPRLTLTLAAALLAGCGQPTSVPPAAAIPDVPSMRPTPRGATPGPAPAPAPPPPTIRRPVAHRPVIEDDPAEPALFEALIVHFDGSRLSERHVAVLHVGTRAADPSRAALGVTVRDLRTTGRRTIPLTRIYAAHDPTTGETDADPAAWLMRRAGVAGDPPPAEAINIWLKPPPKAAIEFRGRRRGARVALAEISALRFLGREMIAVDVLVTHDPLAPEPRARRLGILRRDRDGALYRIAPHPDAEMEGDIESHLLRLARHG